MKNVEQNKLYTQLKYYKSAKLENNEILASLKPFEYELDHSQVKYMGTIYNIYLVSIVEDKKILKKLKDEQYTNAALTYKNKNYNYYIK